MALLNTRRWILPVLSAVATLVVCARATAYAGPQTGEPEIRAAFLYNFTKFVEWPAVPGAKAGDPLRICVVADSAFVSLVESIVAGESAAGRPLVVLSPATPADARVCQVLYVAHAERERGPKALEAVRDLPVLTVSDSPQFLDQGGGIQFVRERRRVRFDINLHATERARLRVSSNLLRVARNIRQNGTVP